MGKAGYLPDISGRFSLWTSHALRCINAEKYDDAKGALNNMNGLLGEDYKITISTDMYNKKVLSDKFFLCNHCTMMIKETINEGREDQRVESMEVPNEVNFADLHVFELKTNFMQSVVLNSRSNRVWRCPKCRNINRLSHTEIIESEMEKPFYLRVVPDPPIRTHSNRIGFTKKFKDWFNTYFEELENALMNYRVDYIKEHGEDMAVPFDKGDKP